jgi:alanine racemase
MVKHSSRIELSQSALSTNLNFIRKKIGPHPKISSVVKANAFGHGIAQMVPMAERSGIRHFAVASASEAEQVVQAHCRPETRVMIMGILYDEDLPWVLEHDIEFYVFDCERLEAALKAAKAVGKQALIHLEVETGCNRTGIDEDNFEKALRFLREHAQHLAFKGMCTHFGGAESLANRFKIEQQMERFAGYRRMLKKKNFLPEYLHMSSSAAALSIPQARMDMVRVGIAQYGYWPSQDMYQLHLEETGKRSDNPLKRVIRWTTDVMHLKYVPKGEFVGYGTAYQATQDITVAVMPLGYANGYPRELGNKGHVLIRGKKAPVIGLVNMNLFMANVSHIPEVTLGDEVVLVGKQQGNSITVGAFANYTNQLNNEMLSSLPEVIPRFVVR